MKYLLRLSSLFILIVFFAAGSVTAQERENEDVRASPNAIVSQTIGTTVVTATYGRPGLKGRTYFEEGADLAPTGEVWRTGANESTNITFSDDVNFGGEEVEAGTYSLYTIPGEDEWEIILNEKLSWGTQFDEAQDVVRVNASVDEGSEVEWFQINFDELSDTEASLNLSWGTTRISVPISTDSGTDTE
ncbi:MAG: DUF2911 domain-containing protein [Balneolaceae bacterium]